VWGPEPEPWRRGRDPVRGHKKIKRQRTKESGKEEKDWSMKIERDGERGRTRGSRQEEKEQLRRGGEEREETEKERQR
jgi:hypothetical protein